MKKAFVIYCPQKGGYWSNALKEFKGELFATKYDEFFHSIVNETLMELPTMKGCFKSS